MRADDPSVSRVHATFSMRDGVPRIQDAGSANGTWVGGRRLVGEESMRLTPGVAVEIGSAVLLLRRGAVDATDELSAHHLESGKTDADTPMQRLWRLSALVAKSKLSVLLVGETGTGKEVVAERIHRSSPRASGPLVKLNCAALPEALFESELFGYEKGAFTGAGPGKPGMLEAASGGTVFFDEVGEMPLASQAKLLRVLESQEVTRIGSVHARSIDVRIVAATNRDLDERIAQGLFREDLYFRLEGLLLQIPPLRDRLDEIPALATEFLEGAARQAGRSAPVLTSACIERLRAQAWPGNVRQLRNVIERAFVLCTGGELLPEHIVVHRGTNASNATTAAPLDERARIERALEQCGGNQTEAARVLGIARRTLINRLESLGVKRPRKRA
jgi:transcriptional regulator with PAS, ATPase and Fis domain